MMSTKTANFNMRMNPTQKKELEELFSSLGMTLPEAVNIFFSKALMVGGLPFDVRRPKYNEATIQAMEEARKISSGEIDTKSYDSAEELFKDLDQEEC